MKKKLFYILVPTLFIGIVIWNICTGDYGLALDGLGELFSDFNIRRKK